MVYANTFIKLIEQKYEVKFMNVYDLPSIKHCYVFYQSNPKLELGHSHYMAVISPERFAIVANGKSIKDARYGAMLIGKDLICSRTHHSFVQHPSGAFVDGGMEYTRYGGHGLIGSVLIEDDHEVFEAFI